MSARYTVVQKRWWGFWWEVMALLFLIGGMLVGCDQGKEPQQNQSLSTEVMGENAFAEKKEPPPNSSLSNQTNPSHRFTTRIVAFGDSLTAGLGVSTQDTYPAQLQQRLEKAGYRIQVINAGVSGETSAGGLRRVGWVLKSRPHLVILELGGNDGLRGLPPNLTKANLAKIIQRFKEAKVPVLLTGMKMPPNLGKDYTEKFANLYPALAKKWNIPLMPFFLEGVATHKTMMQADGIHPTKEGYLIIVENIFREIEPLLNARRRHPQEQ